MFASSAHFLDLDCGISHARIASWLADELGLPYDNDVWTFSAGDHTCLVEVSPLESRVLGPIALERARLTASGDDEALAAFEQLFTLRFISAGG